LFIYIFDIHILLTCIHINDILLIYNMETEMENIDEIDLIKEALEASQFMANQPKPTTKQDNFEQDYIDNKKLEPNKLRNFWYTRNHETIHDFGSKHQEKNAEEYFNHFKNVNDKYHMEQAETCAYRNMIATHAVEMKKATPDNIDITLAQHKCETTLFDVRLNQMKGMEADTTELDKDYREFKEVSKVPEIAPLKQSVQQSIQKAVVKPEQKQEQKQEQKLAPLSVGNAIKLNMNSAKGNMMAMRSKFGMEK
jgi:hypothetical protein